MKMLSVRKSDSKMYEEPEQSFKRILFSTVLFRRNNPYIIKFNNNDKINGSLIFNSVSI